jgi:hypothetical protein
MDLDTLEFERDLVGKVETSVSGSTGELDNGDLEDADDMDWAPEDIEEAIEEEGKMNDDNDEDEALAEDAGTQEGGAPRGTHSLAYFVAEPSRKESLVLEDVVPFSIVNSLGRFEHFFICSKEIGGSKGSGTCFN